MERDDGTVVAAAPRQHRDQEYLAAKRRQTEAAHVGPVNRLAEEIAAATGSVVPHPDPYDGGVRARVLLLLETPSRTGGYRTGFISMDNDDSAAANLWRAVDACTLGRRDLLIWNAVPWYVGSADQIRSPTVAEIRTGVGWLRRLLDLMPELRVVATFGRAAAAAIEPIGAELSARGLVRLAAPHPSQRVYNRPGAQARERVHATLTEAAEIIARPADGPARTVSRTRAP